MRLPSSQIPQIGQSLDWNQMAPRAGAIRVRRFRDRLARRRRLDIKRIARLIPLKSTRQACALHRDVARADERAGQISIGLARRSDGRQNQCRADARAPRRLSHRQQIQFKSQRARGGTGQEVPAEPDHLVASTGDKVGSAAQSTGDPASFRRRRFVKGLADNRGDGARVARHRLADHQAH